MILWAKRELAKDFARGAPRYSCRRSRNHRHGSQALQNRPQQGFILRSRRGALRALGCVADGGWQSLRLVVTWNGPLSKRLMLQIVIEAEQIARFRLSELKSVMHSGLPA